MRTCKGIISNAGRERDEGDESATRATSFANTRYRSIDVDVFWKNGRRTFFNVLGRAKALGEMFAETTGDVRATRFVATHPAAYARMSNVILRVRPGEPRYFHSRSPSFVDGARALTLHRATLCDDGDDGAGVLVLARVDDDAPFVLLRFIRGVRETTSIDFMFIDENVRFDVKGGEVELAGVVERASSEREREGKGKGKGADAVDDDECEETNDEDERTNEMNVAAVTTEGRRDAEERNERAARERAASTSRWRGVDEAERTIDWWDNDDGGRDLKYHVQTPGSGRSKRVREMPSFSWTGDERPRPTTARRSYPNGLTPPDYAESGWPSDEFASRYQSVIEIKPHAARAAMRAACSLARHVMDCVAWRIEPGVTTETLDRLCHAVTIANGAYPSPLNYMGFPKSCCTSVNEVVCHGIPDARPLRHGDVVNVDVTVRLNGYHGDVNETYLVGAYTDAYKDKRRLMECTHRALMKSIEFCRPGRRFRDVGGVIADEAKRSGYASVKDFCGHGVGTLFHCAPNVPHYAPNKTAGVMKEGMTFTIEPMFNASSSHRVVHWPDGWSAATADGAVSAQYEHTVLITADGVEILTARTPNSRPFITFK